MNWLVNQISSYERTRFFSMQYLAAAMSAWNHRLSPLQSAMWSRVLLTVTSSNSKYLHKGSKQFKEVAH